MADEEPTPQEQRRFWDLEARRVGSRSLRDQAALVNELHGENLPDEVHLLLGMVEREHARAEDAYQYFMFEHPGIAFRVFDPDLIEMMFTDDEFEPLDLSGYQPDEEGDEG